MSNIGFIGLGNMGKLMTRNLLKRGFDVTVFDIRQDAINEMVNEGAKEAKSLKALGEVSDIVFVMVLNFEQVENATVSNEGVIHGMKPGSTLIVTSTIAPSEIYKISEFALQKGINTIDAPVSGGVIRAADGSLVMMVACSDAVFNQCQEALFAVGSNTVKVGSKIGLGQTVKAANQLLVSVHTIAMAEALVLATKAGVDPNLLYEIIKKSVGNSYIFELKAPTIMDRDFLRRGALDIHIKDMDICMKMGRELGVPLYLSAITRELFIEADAKGYGKEDFSSIVKLFEEAAHVQVKRQ